MNRSIFSYIIILFSLLACLLMAGCGSESGAPEGLVAQSYDENCSLCHSAGSLADVESVHSIDSNSPQVSITGVTEVNLGGGDIRMEVEFNVADSENPLIPLAIDSARNIRFALAKLDTSGGGSGYRQSYINSSETKAAGDPGTGPDVTVVQATTERGNSGTLTPLATAGEYTYRFSFNMNAVTDPVSGLSITYDPSATHRIAIQYSGNVDNACTDFVPNNLPALGAGVTRDIVTNSSCNECHINLGFHGGDRIHIDYCTTCHNFGSTDANSGNTVDMAVMTHKIHRGESLPAVEAGGEYAIWGHNDSKHDYSTVVFPQDIRNCTVCHNGAADSDNWMNSPGTAVCTSCHDTPDATEYPSFPALTAQQITDAHTIAAQVAAEDINFNILGISTEENTDGDLDVTILFSITDAGDIPYNITDTSIVDLTSLSFLIGWDTSDYTNRGSGSDPAQPLRVGITDATNFGDNIYSLAISSAVPAGVTGSGVVALQGRPSMDLDGDGDVDDRVPATSVAKSFAITDETAIDRREIVDIDKCNKCHGLLSLHGNNRNNGIEVCVICHNADATDLDVRPTDGTAPADGKAEESIDMKYMIHAIHAGESGEDLHGFREEGIVVYGHGGSVHDYSHVRMPAGADSLKNCEGCHNSGTYEIPIDENALPTTVKTGYYADDPDDDSNITPETAVCSSCHDSIDVKTHMASEGGVFDFKALGPAAGEDNGQASSCGPDGTMPAGHVDRTDCCSCHSP